MVPAYPVVLEKRSLNGCSSSSSMYGTVCDISIGFSHAFDVGSVLWLLMVSLPWMHDMCLFSGIVVCFCNDFLPSMLCRCWLGGRKGIRPVKNSRVVGCWCGYLPGAMCRLVYGPADATATHCLLLQ